MACPYEEVFKLNVKQKKSFHLFVLLCCLAASNAVAKPAKIPVEKSPAPAQATVTPEKEKGGLFGLFKTKEFKLIPVPVFETRPDEGNTYGLMPVLLMSDKGANAISAIFALMAQYNDVVKFDGAFLAYFYPEPEQEIEFFAEIGQRHMREFSAHFFDPHLGNFYLEADARYYQTPFTRFFGIGPRRAEHNGSNYVSESFNVDLIGGYYLFDHFRVNGGFRVHNVDVKDRAIDELDSTLTRYGALPNVVDSSNFIYELSTVFDNRPDREYSKKGSKLKGAYFVSNKALGSDKSFHGYNFEAITLIPIHERTTTALRANLQQVFGSRTPFYELSSLGGSTELRSFVPQRFVDQGKVVFQWEQRIKMLSWELLGKSFDIYVDPFVEVGRVFDQFSNLGFNYWQPVVGTGFRLMVPPNVLGRIDMAYGSDGFEIYTELGYPF